MSKSLLQTRIVDKLEVIMTQVDTMNKFGKNIPLIHLDVLKSNIRTLYEQICELERGQMHSTNVQRTVNSLFNQPEETIASKHEEERVVTEATQTISKMIETIQEDVANVFALEVPAEITEIKEDTIAKMPIETPAEAPLLQIETVEVREETIFDKKEEIIFEEKHEEESVVENSIPDIFSSLQTIVDRYKTPDSTLNEAM
ncbi:MAG: hypothetical protein FWC98_05095, partial [Bacteroidales bacterium]|nr:hypothetical protein [Bacteroidales bacterium]